MATITINLLTTFPTIKRECRKLTIMETALISNVPQAPQVSVYGYRGVDSANGNFVYWTSDSPVFSQPVATQPVLVGTLTKVVIVSVP